MLKISKFFKKGSKKSYARRSRLTNVPQDLPQLRTIPENNEVNVTPTSERVVSANQSSYYSSPSFEQSELRDILKELHDELNPETTSQEFSSSQDTSSKHNGVKRNCIADDSPTPCVSLDDIALDDSDSEEFE
jgi:hypothetical protein